MVMRVNIAFVENAEHDIDRDERRQNQQRLVGEGGWKAAAVPWKAATMLSGMLISCCFIDRVVASPREAPGARLKEMVTTGNCP